MSGVTFNAITTAASGAANFIASDLYSVSTDGANKGNFNMLVGALNSGAMNSVNYSNSAFLSNHVSASQIVSQHISGSQVVQAHLSSEAIRNDHMLYQSSDNGVRMFRVGQTNPPDNLMGAKINQSFVSTILGGTLTLSQRILFSNADEGDPGFTDTPILAGRPMFQSLSSGHRGAEYVLLTAINSTAADFIYGFEGAGTKTHTVMIEVYGAT